LILFLNITDQLVFSNIILNARILNFEWHSNAVIRS